MKKLLFLILLSTVFIFIACGDSEGNDNPIDDKECTTNSHCDVGEVCNLDEFKCEIVWLCTDAQTCYDHDSTWNVTENPVVCVSGECKYKGCKSNNDCITGKVCNSGKCETAQDCSLVDSVQILTPSPILTQGSTKELKAVALNVNGVPINTGNDFTWASSEATIVAIDVSGVVTGGTTSGSSDITASVCSKTSVNLSIKNFATLDAGKLRVIVRDIDGKLLDNADVKIGSAAAVKTVDGFITVDNTEATNDLLITMAGYQPVSFLGLSEKDLIIYLNKEINQVKAGGFKGVFDFDHETIATNGEARLGLAGSSLPGNILDLDFGLLLGEPIMKHISIATVDGDFPIPSGLVLILGDNDIVNDSYKSTGLEGDRVLWGWGGRASMVEVIGIVGDAAEGGMDNLDMGKLLSELMPIANKFNHSVKPSQKITLCDKIADTNDVNGDGNTTDLIADFNSSCFPTVNLELNQPLSLSSIVKFPTLPSIDGKKTEAAILLASTIVEGKGMVPLGLGAGTDKVDNDATADGKIDDATFVYAPQHSGLSDNDSMVVLMTMPIDMSGLTEVKADEEEADMPVKLTGIVKYYKGGAIEDTINLSGDTYLGLAEDAKITNTTVSFTAIAGASLYRLSVTDVTGVNWLVYSSSTSVSLENTPTGFGAIDFVVVQAVVLKDNGTDVSYDSLLKFNSSNLDDLIRLITKFSAWQVNTTVK